MHHPSQGKICKTAPYSLSGHHSDVPFALIHMGIWGPYRAVTQQKYRYFLTIVDDHSRATWAYLLQNKSENGTGAILS